MCSSSDDVEDEQHFLFECPGYRDIRYKYGAQVTVTLGTSMLPLVFSRSVKHVLLILNLVQYLHYFEKIIICIHYSVRFCSVFFVIIKVSHVS